MTLAPLQCPRQARDVSGWQNGGVADRPAVPIRPEGAIPESSPLNRVAAGGVSPRGEVASTRPGSAGFAKPAAEGSRASYFKAGTEAVSGPLWRGGAHRGRAPSEVGEGLTLIDASSAPRR